MVVPKEGKKYDREKYRRKTERLYANVSTEKKEKFKEKLGIVGKSMQEVIESAIDEFIK